METGIQSHDSSEKTVVVADEHAVFVQGLASILRTLPQINISGQTTWLGTLLELVLERKPDLVVTGYHLLIEGSPRAGRMRAEEIYWISQHSRIMVFTPHPSEALHRLILRAGAYFVQSKDCEIGAMIRAVTSALHTPHPGKMNVGRFGPPGSIQLSRSEKRVLDLYLSGMNITAIASLLDRSRKTVSAQKVSAMRKLGVSSNQELILLANSFPISANSA